MTQGNVIGRYMIGNTKITICDDYCAKTDEGKKKILDNISKIFSHSYDEKSEFVDEPLTFPDSIVDLNKKKPT